MARGQSAVGVARGDSSVSDIVKSAFEGNSLQNFTPDESGIILQLWAHKRGDEPMVNEAQLVQELVSGGMIDEARATTAMGELKRTHVIWTQIRRGQGVIINYLEMRGSLEEVAASRFAGAENARGEQAPSNGGAPKPDRDAERHIAWSPDPRASKPEPALPPVENERRAVGAIERIGDAPARPAVRQWERMPMVLVKAAFINNDSCEGMAFAMGRGIRSTSNYLHALDVYGRYPRDRAVRVKMLANFEAKLASGVELATAPPRTPGRRPSWLMVERLLEAVVKHGPRIQSIAGEIDVTEHGLLTRLSRFGVKRVIDIPLDVHARVELAMKVLAELERKDGVRGIMRGEFLDVFVQNGTARGMAKALGTTPNIAIDCTRALRIKRIPMPSRAEREIIANEIREKYGASLTQRATRTRGIEPTLAPVAPQAERAELKNDKTIAPSVQVQENAPHHDKKAKQMIETRKAKGITAKEILDGFVVHNNPQDIAAGCKQCTPENIRSRLPKILKVTRKRAIELLSSMSHDDKRALADKALGRLEQADAPGKRQEAEPTNRDAQRTERMKPAQSKAPMPPANQGNIDGARELEEFSSAFRNLDSQFGSVAESAKLLRGATLGKIVEQHRERLKADVNAELSEMAKAAARQLADREIAEAAKHVAIARRYALKGYVSRGLLRGIAEAEREERRNAPRGKSTAQ